MSKLTKELFLAGARFRENFTTLQSSYAYIPPSTGARYSYGRIDRYLSGKDQYECSVIDVDDKGFKISTNVVGHPVTVHRPFTDFILIEKEAPVEPA